MLQRETLLRIFLQHSVQKRLRRRRQPIRVSKNEGLVNDALGDSLLVDEIGAKRQLVLEALNNLIDEKDHMNVLSQTTYKTT